MKKTKFLFSVIIMILISTNMIAQDKIYLKDGENIEAKILEVNVDNIKYKKFTNIEGPTFTIAKKDVQMLVYENGESEIFKEDSSSNDVGNTTINNNPISKSERGGGAKLGLNVGLPVGEYSELTSFSLSLEFAYLGEVAENFEIGGLVGYLHYFGGKVDDPWGNYDIEDVGYIPIAFSSRYYFGDRKFFAGFDLGYAIAVSDYIDGGFYYRPKFGFNLGAVNLILSYSSISENNYKESSVNGGVEFNLN